MDTPGLFKPEIQEPRELLLELPAPDVSDLLREIDETKRILLLRLLPRRILPEVFAYLGAKLQEDTLKAITDEETRVILAGMPPDDRTEFLEELPGQAITKLLSLLSPEDRRETLQLLGYPEESVGRRGPLKASYRDASAWSLYGKRVTWLASLLLISIISTGIIAARTEMLSSAIALAFFIPLLIGTGGNTGNQSATLMLRALATGDIHAARGDGPCCGRSASGYCSG